MPYDPSRDRLVAFGGRGDGRASLTDTWEWDRRSWARVGAAWSMLPAAGPESRVANSMVSTPKGAVLVTTRLADTPTFPIELWRWSGTVWQSIADPGPSLSPTAPTAWTHGGLLVFAGWEPDGSAKAWSWNEREWRAVAVEPALRRKGTALAYDEARDRLVLFGGADDHQTFGDTWEWDGVLWTRIR